LFASLGEGVIHTVLVATSIAVLLVSVKAYSVRGGLRYFALMIAFFFLMLSQSVQFVESYYVNGFIFVPFLEVHLSHLFDLATLLSFAAALLVRQENRIAAQ